MFITYRLYLTLTLQRPNSMRKLIEMIHIIESFRSLQSVLHFKSSSITDVTALPKLVITLI
jgi:hypothetical protein